MRNLSQAIMSALTRDAGGIALIWCPADVGIRDWLATEVGSLAPVETRVHRCDRVEEAIAHPNDLVLLLPERTGEADVVLDLNGSRDRIVNGAVARTQPIVLFLFRNGDGQRTLAMEAASLRSITAGSDPDSEQLAEVDVSAEQKRFKVATGSTPHDWLQGWKSGQIAHTGANFTRTYQAMLLESR